MACNNVRIWSIFFAALPVLAILLGGGIGTFN